MRNKKTPQNKEKRNRNNAIILIIAMVAVGIGIQTAFIWVESATGRMALLGAAAIAYAAATAGWFLCRRKRKNPKTALIDVLQNAGFECRLTDEDDICIRVGESPIYAHVVDLPKKGHHRVHFSALMAVDEKHISEQGINYMISQMNSHNEYFTMLKRDECLECRVETVVSEAKDMLQELSFALDQIGRAVRVYEKNIKAVSKQYPVIDPSQSERKVGFQIPSPQSLSQPASQILPQPAPQRIPA